MGPQHGYGLARRIEQISGDRLSLNYGTLYPALLKLEQEGAITSEWGLSDNNRRAKFYSLTRTGRRQLERQTRDWQQTTAIVARFLSKRVSLPRIRSPEFTSTESRAVFGRAIALGLIAPPPLDNQ